MSSLLVAKVEVHMDTFSALKLTPIATKEYLYYK